LIPCSGCFIGDRAAPTALQNVRIRVLDAHNGDPLPNVVVTAARYHAVNSDDREVPAAIQPNLEQLAISLQQTGITESSGNAILPIHTIQPSRNPRQFRDALSGETYAARISYGPFVQYVVLPMTPKAEVRTSSMVIRVGYIWPPRE
jgi:hypothetical protein